MTTTYQTKLKDPRWQKKRLEILQRDNWTCRLCEDKQNSLTVHHKLYLPQTEPWDYPDELLITLCVDCHERETIDRPEEETRLIRILKLCCSTTSLELLINNLEELNNNYKKFQWEVVPHKNHSNIILKFTRKR